MSEVPAQLQVFINNTKLSQQIWGLKDPASDDWVVCDSLDFDETDVMPLWSEQTAAAAYCAEEWATYKPVAISVDDYLEFWVEDLNDDGVLLGLDWLAEEEAGIEVDPIDVAKAFADYESLA
jgi:hypothetical protein